MTRYMYQPLVILCMTIILCAASCKKEDKGPQLPAETKIGANTSGFKINNRTYTAKGQVGLLSSEGLYYSILASDSTMYVSLQNPDQKFRLIFRIKYTGQLANYTTAEFPYKASFEDLSDGTLMNNSNFYQTNAINNGSIEIKHFNGSLNPVQPGTVLAGTFDIKLINGDGKVIHITDGRFDIGR